MTRAKRHFRYPLSAFRSSSGFTLMELMVVMGIIVLMLGMGVLAFNALTGNRSISMAQNQVAATLGRARAIAMNQSGNEPVAYGVFFFRDPQNDRTAMAILRVPSVGSSDADPYDNYKAWTVGVRYNIGDHVVAIVTDISIGARKLVTARRFQALQAHTANYTNRPPLDGTQSNVSNAYWMEVSPFPDADIPAGEEIQYLPNGIGLQTLQEQMMPPAIEHYLRTGVILFDRQGRLEYLPYRITPTSTIGAQLGLTGPLPPLGVNLYSQCGVVLYENEQFRSQPFASDADLTFILPGQTTPLAADEANEEGWLDQNTSLLLVNRYSGELLKAR